MPFLSVLLIKEGQPLVDSTHSSKPLTELTCAHVLVRGSWVP